MDALAFKMSCFETHLGGPGAVADWKDISSLQTFAINNMQLIFDNMFISVHFRLWSNETHERCCQAIQVVPFAIQNAFRLKQEHTLVVPPLYTNKQIITPAQKTIKVRQENYFWLYFLFTHKISFSCEILSQIRTSSEYHERKQT